MLKSMTAFGRATVDCEVGHFVLEIQSVNRKFLEINVLSPKELSRFDIDLKKWLMPHIGRGQVTVKLSASFDSIGNAPVIVKPNLVLALQLKQAWDQIATALNTPSEFNLNLISETEGLFLFEENVMDEDCYKQALKAVLSKALEGFLQMKEKEGMALQLDISNRLKKIEEWVNAIEILTPGATKKYQEKLVARLEEVVPGHIENEDRILREIALFAEKIDITEEITRFHCHLVRLEEIFQSSHEAVGKTLEFILQELGREINTISSKSSDIEIANYAINIKSELEKIREQIQNVE